MANYAQGWPLIQAAIITRLQAVSGIGKVWPDVKHVRENPKTKVWQDAYVSSGKVNVCFVVNDKNDGDETFEFDAQRRSKTTSVEIQLYRGYEIGVSFGPYDALVLAIQAAFNDDACDRTLNLTCLTHSQLQCVESGRVPEFAGHVDCHSAIITFQVEEVY